MPKVPMPIKGSVRRHTDSPRHQAQPPPRSPRHQAAPPASTPATSQAAQQPASESVLDVLRRNVEQKNVDNKLKGNWTASDLVKMDELIKKALVVIDNLELQGKLKPDWNAEILGASFIIYKGVYVKQPDEPGDRLSMRFWWRHNHWLAWADKISTDKDPALILFADGTCAFVSSEIVGSIPVAVLHDMAKDGVTVWTSGYRQTKQRLQEIENRNALKW